MCRGSRHMKIEQTLRQAARYGADDEACRAREADRWLSDAVRGGADKVQSSNPTRLA